MGIDLSRFFEMEIVGEKRMHIGTEDNKKHFLCKAGNQTFLMIELEDGTSHRINTREKVESEYNRIIGLNLDSEHKDKINQWYKSINQ